MRLHSTIFAMLVGAALLAGPAIAGNQAQHSHAGAELASMQLEHDPFAQVYIVTSSSASNGTTARRAVS